MTRQTLSLLSYKIAMAAAITVIGASTPVWAGNPHAPSLLPAHPNAGECYARVKIPAQYSTGRQGILVEDGYKTLEATDPVLQSRQEQVLVKEASVRYVVRQPRYKTVMDKIMTRPSYDKLSVTKPQFSTVTETVQTSSPRLVWKRGNPVTLRQQGYIIHSTADAGYSASGHSGAQSGELCGTACDIWCLVEEPGESVSYKRRVLSAPAQVRRVNVPAQYQHISKQIVADPGGVKEIPVPAEYRSVTVQDLVDPGEEHARYVQPKYASVETKTLISPERYEWRRVVCAPGTGATAPASSYSPVTYGQGHASGSTHNGTTFGVTPHKTSPKTYYPQDQSGPTITYHQRKRKSSTCLNRRC